MVHLRKNIGFHPQDKHWGLNISNEKTGHNSGVPNCLKVIEIAKEIIGRLAPHGVRVKEK